MADANKYKMKEIGQLTDPELENLEAELKKERFNLTIQSKTGQIQNSARKGQIRKTIARILTEWKIRKKKLAVN
jgi:large subunit ribosomal protein L29